MIKNLTLITGNPNKAKQVEKYLKYPVTFKDIDLVEIQSFELEEVLEHKAKEAYNLIKKPVLVDDVSFVANALVKLPGPFIRWFEDGLGYPKFCKMLNVFQDKSAIVKAGISLHDGEKIHLFTGEIKGVIANEPRGENGFGFDVIFIPEGYEITRAQMKEEDYDKTSSRRIALEKLADYLKEKG